MKKGSLYDRVLEATGLSKAVEVAVLLGVTPAALTRWKNEGGVKVETLLKCSNLTGISIHWLLTGEGEKYVGEIVASATKKLAQKLPVEDTARAPKLIPGIGLPTANLSAQPVPLFATINADQQKLVRRTEEQTVLVPGAVVHEGSVIFVIEGDGLEAEGLRDGDMLIAIPAKGNLESKLVIALHNGRPIIREFTQHKNWALFSSLGNDQSVIRVQLNTVDIKFEVTSLIHNFKK